MKRSKRSRGWVAAAVGLAVVGVAGCGAANTSVNSTSHSSTPSPGAASASSSSVLTVAPNVTGTFSDNFNPFSTNSMPGTLGNIYETLFYFDNTTGKQFNLLGTSFRFSNGGKTLTVSLRKNAVWTDGVPFTAQDVVFTFEDLKKYPDADTNGVWQQLKSVQAEGKYTVVFQFEQPNIPFAEQYVLGGTYIVPAHQWKSLGDPAKAKITHLNAIGTGPFKLSSFTTQDYQFTANPRYYGGAPEVKTLNYPAFASNSSADLALASGQIQYAGINIPNVEKTFVAADPAHNHYLFPPNEPVELYPNLHNPLLAMLPVREAISLAIDRNALSKIGETGYEKPAVPTSLVLPPQSSWLDPSLPASYRAFTLNDAKAVQILQKAGFRKDQNGIFALHGKELSFNLLTVSGWSDWDEDALLIKQQLAKVGIAVNVQEEQFSAYYSAIDPGPGQTPHYDLAISWTNVGPTPYTTYYDMLDSHGSFNLEGYRNAQVDQWFNEFSSTTDSRVQHQVMYRIERLVASQLPVIPLLDGALWYEYNDRHFTGFPTANNLWINPAPYTYQAAAIIMDHLKPVK
ncbi:ABC transporter substrate-binding protein [Alicyclobacillus acidocaldarius]|uniref:Extracellular solute-binding protein family 5 n=1 Tax=Alicyclobacillus acidocaldarius (strain Tc-4-1) TaxID=1048834 RepID=F8IE70_ALIAT|nr:ABC transporter substrate-binding protein [Alicyclobacillus acidocaldarius]AEJ43912.1 extracellular solute-binding protein family 5 [Alicyclobacillus acidocaldarius subsp. acidocaldarius Tc-4-1]